MKFRKRIAPILMGVFVGTVVLTSTASAHNGDYWLGKYIGKSGADILLRITSSAQTDLLNWVDVYSGGYSWCNISSNVNVRLAYSTAGMPALSGEMYVVGEYRADRVLGKTIPYNSTGEIAWKDEYNKIYDVQANWDCVKIIMNTNPTAYSNASDPSAAARMTFIHEVGHALKLSHPVKSSSISGHNINGLPSAVMNQGFPGNYNGATSATVTAHDKVCLKAKWGS